MNHFTIDQLPYSATVRTWLKERYGEEQSDLIWKKTEEKYASYLNDVPDFGGKKNGHALAIYGGLLIFALYPSLPDQPPVKELQEFVQNMFMSSFIKLGGLFDLNRSADMRIIDSVFRFSGNRDRKDAVKYPGGFINVDVPYDRKHHAARYRFTQCPNAEFAKKHGLLHVLPLLCNCDFFGISAIHGQLIRCSTCGNGNVCDYLVVGDHNPIASEYITVTDDSGFLVSRKKRDGHTDTEVSDI